MLMILIAIIIALVITQRKQLAGHAQRASRKIGKTVVMNMPKDEPDPYGTAGVV